MNVYKIIIDEKEDVIVADNPIEALKQINMAKIIIEHFQVEYIGRVSSTQVENLKNQ